MLTLIRILFDLLVQFLALVFGCVPLLRSLIFTEHSFFYFLFDSLNILGLVINYVFILFSYSREHGGVSFCGMEPRLICSWLCFCRGATVPCIMLVLGGNLLGGTST